MKQWVTFMLSLICSLASADIYKAVNPKTGASEYSNAPLRGSVNTSTGELVPDEYFVEQARIQARMQANKAAAIALLTKEYPDSCKKFSKNEVRCLPRVGMKIDRHAGALNMKPAGFVEDAANGKLDRWLGVCVAYSRAGVVVSVAC